MIHIGYVVSNLRRTGPTNQLLDLVRHLDSAVVRPSILTLSPEPPGTLSAWPAFEAVGAHIESLNGSRVLGLLSSGARVAEWVERRGVDIIHSHGVRADWLMARTPVCPRVATLHNTPDVDYRLAYGPAGFLLAGAHRRALRRLERVVAVSGSVEKSGVPSGATGQVIHNGVDTERFVSSTENGKQRLRSELGLPREASVVVAVGRLSKRKNMSVVIEATLALDGVHVVVVGAGEQADELARRFGNEARVHLVGRDHDVQRWLQAADVFGSASRGEGLPYSVIEAMACGLPVVLSDIAPHREILRPRPTAGAIVDGDDVTDIAGALERVLADSHSAGVEARRAVLSDFSAAAMAEAYQRLYLEVAGLAGRDGAAA